MTTSSVEATRTYHWTIELPAEPTQNIVVIKNIALATQEVTIKDFFSFCGIIKAFEMKKDEYDEQHQVALVYFEQEAAAKTATLLSQAVVDDCPIEVEPYFKQVPIAENPAKNVTPAARTETTSASSAQQPQESKSVSHVMAELLASGYVLTESVVTKGAEFDQKHGVSTRVNGYLNKVGINLSQRKSTTAATASEDRTTSQDQTPNKPSRMHGLMNSRASLKMQGLASRVVDKVSVVHEEAKKIAAEKKKKEASVSATHINVDDHKPNHAQ